MEIDLNGSSANCLVSPNLVPIKISCYQHSWDPVLMRERTPEPNRKNAAELASQPRQWPSGSDEELEIPPTTPRHPTEPVGRELIPAGAEGPGTPEHFHEFPQWVNGWCVYAWIIWQPNHGDPPLYDRAHLSQWAGDPVKEGNRRQIHRIVEEVRKANEIFWNDCQIAFQVCDVITIDSSRITYGPPNNPSKLSEVFNQKGQLTLADDSNPFAAALQEIITNGGPNEFVDKMRKRCVHLFFTHDVEDTSSASEEEGAGGLFDFGNRKISYGLVDAGSEILAQTIVHEIVHSLGQMEHSTTPGSVFQPAIGPSDTTLDGNLCRPLRLFLEENIDPACP